MENFRAEIPTWESTFTSLAVTGFLVPIIPGVLGFKLFGRGIGGILRTFAASSATSITAAHVLSPRSSANLVDGQTTKQELSNQK
jgi:hypothetical protein